MIIIGLKSLVTPLLSIIVISNKKILRIGEKSSEPGYLYQKEKRITKKILKKKVLKKKLSNSFEIEKHIKMDKRK